MIKIENKKKYFIIYSLLFSLIMILIFVEYIITGTTFVCAKDSLAQHYPYMLKVKEFYESLLLSIFQGNAIELLDFNAYFGLDVISSYNYYGLGNPLYILTIGWPIEFMPYVYSIIVILKIYLAGISFSYLCFYYNKPYLPTLLGTLMYVLSPLVIGSIAQMIFMDIYYQFPLLIAGFNQILKGKKSPLFAITITLSALNGYYFLYIMTVILAVYGIIMVIKNNCGIKNIIHSGLTKLISTFVHYLLGLMIAAPTFLPSIICFFNSYRTSTISTTSLDLFYDMEYYTEQLMFAFFYCSKNLRVSIIMIFVGILLIRTKEKKYNFVKITILLLILGAQIPLVGMVLNGFAYPSNRWLFCFYLLLSLIAVDMFDNFLNSTSDRKPKYLIISAIFALTIIQTAFFNHFFATSCATAKDIQELAEATIVNEIETNDRIDGDADWRYNTSMFYDISKAQYYISTLPDNLLSTQLSFDLPTVDNTNEVQGLDSRTELEALFNIEYFLTRNSKENIPYGFSSVDTEKDDLYLYKNDYLLPFGYTYDSYIDRSAIEDFIGVDKSWTSMEHAVIDDIKTTTISTDEALSVDSTCLNVPITKTTDSEGNIILSFDTISNAEIYVKLRCLSDIDGKYIFITTKDSSSFFTIKNPNSNWYINKDFEIYNAGYHKDISEITITSNYPCEDIEVYYHPMDNYIEQIEKLSEYHLENIEWKTNKITGTISIPDNRIMCLSIPKIDGWTAYVDGRETEILSVNGMFMGLDLEPGSHTVEFIYFTPGLKFGLTLCVLGLIAFLLLCYKNHKLNRTLNI